MRKETRRERYESKVKTAIDLPLSIVTVSFDFDDNLAFTIRTAACYGVRDIYVIGKIPDRSKINPKSGSLVDYVNIRSFANPRDFVSFANDNDFCLVSAELTDDSVCLFDYEFNIDRHTCIALGHETTGVPIELILNGDVVFIPMLGVGYCLNTSQTGTAVMTEYVRQYLSRGRL
jgi:tRNA G18 (ribose-2'-O)-methylase SpoU